MGSVAYAKKVSGNGEFIFNYLPKANFHIAAFSDLNENRIWDENEIEISSKILFPPKIIIR